MLMIDFKSYEKLLDSSNPKTIPSYVFFQTTS